MRILGLETSCDETAVAIYDAQKGLLAHVLYSQVALHAEYGGVVPELASRDHSAKLLGLIDEIKPQGITGIAFTVGPGLAGALLVGAALGRSLGYAWGVPAIGVHHMEGHLLAPMLEPHPPEFPFVALLVSGGHTLLVNVAGLGQYQILGESVDDAVGEAFDKTAKLLGIPYPGGAALAALSEQGNPNRFHFPRPMLNRAGLDFSFSGLKTAAAQIIAKETLDEQTRADIARSFQDTAVETLSVKCQRALQVTGQKRLVVAGGVGANKALREALAHIGADVYFPRHEFCTDNGAMIAYVGCQRLLAGQTSDLSIQIWPRWSLDQI